MKFKKIALQKWLEGEKQNDIILEIDGNKVESIMDVSKLYYICLQMILLILKLSVLMMN